MILKAKTGINPQTWKLVVTGAALTFAVILTVSVGLVTYASSQSNDLRNAQVRACKQLGNPRARAVANLGEIVSELLATAETTRIKSAHVEHGPQRVIDLRAAKRYRTLAAKVWSPPQADCEAIYPKP